MQPSDIDISIQERKAGSAGSGELAIVETLLGTGVDRPRARIQRLIEAVGAIPQVEMPVTHHFAPHVYGREIFIPKGTVAVGKIHRHAHMSVLVRGDITCLSKRGLQRVSGSCVMPVAEPFTQRAVYAHEDTVLLCIHPTEQTDLALIEAEVIATDYAEADVLDIDAIVSELLTNEGD